MKLDAIVSIDEKGILAQMEKTIAVAESLRHESYKLCEMMKKSQIREKGDSEESSGC